MANQDYPAQLVRRHGAGRFKVEALVVFEDHGDALIHLPGMALKAIAWGREAAILREYLEARADQQDEHDRRRLAQAG